MSFIERIKEDADLSLDFEERMSRFEDIHADALDLLSFYSSRVKTIFEDSVDKRKIEDLVSSLAELHLCFTSPGTDFYEVTREILAIEKLSDKRAIIMLSLSFQKGLDCLLALEKYMNKNKLEKHKSASAMRS